jgi:hypothetical protein
MAQNQTPLPSAFSAVRLSAIEDVTAEDAEIAEKKEKVYPWGRFTPRLQIIGNASVVLRSARLCAMAQNQTPLPSALSAVHLTAIEDPAAEDGTVTRAKNPPRPAGGRKVDPRAVSRVPVRRQA